MLLYIFLLIIPILAISALFLTNKGSSVKEYIRFFITGLDSGFKPSQIIFLGNIGQSSGLEDISTLFWSLTALDRCTAEIIRRSRQIGTENNPASQNLLSRLYTYRTKIELDQSKKKRGLVTTRDILVGQRIRILLRGVGVFSSKVMLNTSRNLILDFPTGTKTTVSSIDWRNCTVGIYFWRHDDAGYVFDTQVVSDPYALGKAMLHVAHSTNLVRSQKRKSIRVKCSIYAQLYLVKPGEPMDNALEPEPGMKCLVEDLSEDGAMIIIGGKAVKNMQIKLQFLVHDVLIVMSGYIRAVDHNSGTNQSRIHFESGELNPRMKNAILSFVYNVLPEEEREELDAIRLTEEDGLEEVDSAKGSDSMHGNLNSIEELPSIPDFFR